MEPLTSGGGSTIAHKKAENGITWRIRLSPGEGFDLALLGQGRAEVSTTTISPGEGTITTHSTTQPLYAGIGALGGTADVRKMSAEEKAANKEYAFYGTVTMFQEFLQCNLEGNVSRLSMRVSNFVGVVHLREFDHRTIYVEGLNSVFLWVA